MNVRINVRNLEKCTYYFLVFCIFIGIILHIVPYFYNRSMWIDEAMLASSICTRSFRDLVSSPLDWGQSGAIGYLFIVKILTSVFGTSETVLRIWSLFSSFGCIVITYLLLKDKVKQNYALFVTALFALTDRFIYYGNEVKPYMSDNLFCLIVLLLWQKYRDKKVKLWQLVLFFAIAIWFSFSAVFFIAACMIIEMIHIFRKLIVKKDIHIICSLALCLIVLISFLLNYEFWLSNTSDNAGGMDYWNNLRFPLIPSSLSDIVLILKMGIQFFGFYPKVIAGLFIFLILLYIMMCIKSKMDVSNLMSPFLLSLFLLLVASYLGFYPIQDRLVQIYQLIGIIIAGYACNEIEQSHSTDDWIVNTDWIRLFYYGILTGCLAIVGMYGCKNLLPKYVYKSGSEVSASMDYLRDNMTSDDVVYVFRTSIPIYTYEIGYDVTYSELNNLSSDNNPKSSLSALPWRKENTIFGQGLFSYYYQKAYSYEGEDNMDAINEDTDIILENNSVYLFTSHGESGISSLIDILEEYGTVETVVDYYDTHLYHFTKCMER